MGLRDDSAWFRLLAEHAGKVKPEGKKPGEGKRKRERKAKDA